jgi:hypothetical protein
MELHSAHLAEGPIRCPLCGKECADRYGVTQHMFSKKHKNGQDVWDKIDWLMTNLQEAQRAIEIYRRLARENDADGQPAPS